MPANEAKNVSSQHRVKVQNGFGLHNGRNGKLSGFPVSFALKKSNLKPPTENGHPMANGLVFVRDYQSDSEPDASAAHVAGKSLPESQRKQEAIIEDVKVQPILHQVPSCLEKKNDCSESVVSVCSLHSAVTSSPSDKPSHLNSPIRTDGPSRFSSHKRPRSKSPDSRRLSSSRKSPRRSSPHSRISKRRSPNRDQDRKGFFQRHSHDQKTNRNNGHDRFREDHLRRDNRPRDDRRSSRTAQGNGRSERRTGPFPLEGNRGRRSPRQKSRERDKSAVKKSAPNTSSMTVTKPPISVKANPSFQDDFVKLWSAHTKKSASAEKKSAEVKQEGLLLTDTCFPNDLQIPLPETEEESRESSLSGVVVDVASGTAEECLVNNSNQPPGLFNLPHHPKVSFSLSFAKKNPTKEQISVEVSISNYDEWDASNGLLFQSPVEETRKLWVHSEEEFQIARKTKLEPIEVKESAKEEKWVNEQISLKEPLEEESLSPVKTVLLDSAYESFMKDISQLSSEPPKETPSVFPIPIKSEPVGQSETAKEEGLSLDTKIKFRFDKPSRFSSFASGDNKRVSTLPEVVPEPLVKVKLENSSPVVEAQPKSDYRKRSPSKDASRKRKSVSPVRKFSDRVEKRSKPSETTRDQKRSSSSRAKSRSPVKDREDRKRYRDERRRTRSRSRSRRRIVSPERRGRRNHSRSRSRERDRSPRTRSSKDRRGPSPPRRTRSPSGGSKYDDRVRGRESSASTSRKTFRGNRDTRTPSPKSVADSPKTRRSDEKSPFKSQDSYFTRNARNSYDQLKMQSESSTTPIPSNPSTVAAQLLLEQEVPFPIVNEPVTGVFPVPFGFEKIGPVFCWPYYLPDCSILLVPYLGLQRLPTEASVQRIVLIPRKVTEKSLTDPCPPGMVSLSSMHIPTYDPTRALPPPPPLATPTINQPSKPKLMKWMRILAKERERLRNAEVQAAKLLFQSETPSSADKENAENVENESEENLQNESAPLI